MRVVGYIRVSTRDMQENSIEVQTERLHKACALRGLELVAMHVDRESGRSMARREGLRNALNAARRNEVEGIIVTHLDRLTRSVRDCSLVLETLDKSGVQLVCLNPDVDTRTPYGKAFMQMAAVFAELERKLIADRIRAARPPVDLEAARASMRRAAAINWIDPNIKRRVMYEADVLGYTRQQIADGLNADGIVRPSGKTFDEATVRKLIYRIRNRRTGPDEDFLEPGSEAATMIDVTN